MFINKRKLIPRHSTCTIEPMHRIDENLSTVDVQGVSFSFLFFSIRNATSHFPVVIFISGTTTNNDLERSVCAWHQANAHRGDSSKHGAGGIWKQWGTMISRTFGPWDGIVFATWHKANRTCDECPSQKNNHKKTLMDKNSTTSWEMSKRMSVKKLALQSQYDRPQNTKRRKHRRKHESPSHIATVEIGCDSNLHFFMLSSQEWHARVTQKKSVSTPSRGATTNDEWFKLIGCTSSTSNHRRWSNESVLAVLFQSFDCYSGSSVIKSLQMSRVFHTRMVIEGYEYHSLFLRCIVRQAIRWNFKEYTTREESPK